MIKANQIVSRIKEEVGLIDPKAELILFGSRARGDHSNDSDWDLLILVSYPVDLKTEQKFRHRLFNIELEYAQAISTKVEFKNTWQTKYKVTPLYQSIAKEGRRL